MSRLFCIFIAKPLPMNIRSILVPTDFSPCSLNALRIAVQLAQQFNARLHLVHAIRVPTPHAGVSARALVDPIVQGIGEEVEAHWARLEGEVPGLASVKYEHQVFRAHALDAIYTAMKTGKADLIVMGTKGSHSSLEKMLGGVSTDVIRMGEVPVLVVPEAVEQFRPERIALAADFKQTESFASLDILKRLVMLFSSEIWVVNVTDGDPQRFASLVESFKVDKFLASTPHRFETVKSDSVTKGLFRFVADNRLDMLVMMPRRHGLFDRIFSSSQTQKVAMAIQVPLLAVPV